jgi:hypothetical protein
LIPGADAASNGAGAIQQAPMLTDGNHADQGERSSRPNDDVADRGARAAVVAEHCSGAGLSHARRPSTGICAGSHSHDGARRSATGAWRRPWPTWTRRLPRPRATNNHSAGSPHPAANYSLRADDAFHGLLSACGSDQARGSPVELNNPPLRAGARQRPIPFFLCGLIALRLFREEATTTSLSARQ